MTEDYRDINNVLLRIYGVIHTCCEDPILTSHWSNLLAWFPEFDEEMNKYCNIAPEIIEEVKWNKLYEIINTNIPQDSIKHDWEEKIVNIFTGKDNGEDISENYDYDEDYYYYYNEEAREQQEKTMGERAASRRER